MGLFLLAIVLPVLLYVVLSSDWAQQRIRHIGETELSTLLGTEVCIESVSYRPFNRLSINDVSVKDDRDSVALDIHTISTRFELWDLILRQKIIIDFASISQLDLHLYRDSIGAPLNIQSIIDHLSRPKSDQPTAVFALRLNDLNLESCSISYDVADQPLSPDRFNPQHIHIKDISLSAFLPLLSNDDYRVRLRSLSFTEQSGFVLSDLSFNGMLNADSVRITNMQMRTPQSLLVFDKIMLPLQGISSIPTVIRQHPLHIALHDDSHVYLPDFKAFLPALSHFDYRVNLDLDVLASLSSIDIASLSVSDALGVFNADISGAINNFNDIDSLSVSNLTIDVSTDTTVIANVLADVSLSIPKRTRQLLAHLGRSNISGVADGSLSHGVVDLTVKSSLASASLAARFNGNRLTKVYNVIADADIDSLHLGIITGNDDLNRLVGNISVDGCISHKAFEGDIKANVTSFDLKGYNYHDITASANISPKMITGDARISDPNAHLVALGQWSVDDDSRQSLMADVALSGVRLDTLHLASFCPGYSFSGTMRADIYGESIDRFRGNLSVSNLSLLDSDGEGALIRSFDVSADNLSSAGRIIVSSDVLNGTIDGAYSFSTLPDDIHQLYSSIIPALDTKSQTVNSADVDTSQSDYVSYNNFAYDFTVNPCEDLCDFLNLPVAVVDPLVLSGYFHGSQRTFHLYCDTPWLAMGNNSYIEDPDIVVDLDGANAQGDIFLECRMPTKKGKMEVSSRIAARDAVLDADIDWSLIREKPINGKIDFSVIFSRDSLQNLATRIDFNPGKINFGNEIWQIPQSSIIYSGNKAIINDFALITDIIEGSDNQNDTNVNNSYDFIPNGSLMPQSVLISGILGNDDDDLLTVKLSNIQLINIFETLDINNALISGFATGTVTAQALLSKNPIIQSDALHIKDIGYNYCTLGDAVAKLNFDDGGSIFNFYADVTQPSGHHSSLDGYIVPATEELNLNIHANHIKVGFMKPFMSAFTSDVMGFASGYANLYGTFKDIDMCGDIYADSLAVKIDFTNTWYHASDSIHIAPGVIKLQDIVIRDDYGNTAMLNGWVGHHYFHNASFEFNVTDAQNFICYDVSEKQSPIWYGRIFGNGGVVVKGQPGSVDIKARISTAENSTFTFVLSDQEEADEYQFITFRDATPHLPTDSILDRNITPTRIQDIIARSMNADEDSPTNYVMDLEVDATPQAQLIIVMDPIGGDRIRAKGAGNMRMIYTSVDNDVRLYGKYTLENGDYNFTLQDIIRKDFTIMEGSAINFSGDPYKAELDINAYAQISANLSDLDESFLQDKELNRTNVPVRALLLLRGDMMQPNISFDLAFPTLTEDTYRKVKSIVSTEDMMSKQIIYLLLLNRFYTPEYMASTTKGNELFSVASSTLASQLSNMLGKLSENWSIAPNLRSDRGDFSDVEVDVTLSSSLLNNRLLFNGNFGYRDKSLNTNQFVGDFDLEYLLDSKGEWRFKAYNRYNDQNYYLRTAQTTQGLGLVYRKDFDRTLHFLNRLFGKHSSDQIAPTDSLIAPTDTIEILNISPADSEN